MSNEDFYSEDLAKLGAICRQFLDGSSDSERFVEDVKKTLRGYDAITLSMTLWQVEATVQKHFCEFWDECRDGNCFEKESPSHYRQEIASWTPLKLP